MKRAMFAAGQLIWSSDWTDKPRRGFCGNTIYVYRVAPPLALSSDAL
jgi:hypothetical protein